LVVVTQCNSNVYSLAQDLKKALWTIVALLVLLDTFPSATVLVSYCLHTGRRGKKMLTGSEMIDTTIAT